MAVRSILFADDNSFAVHGFQMAFERAGFTVHLATTGAAAIKLATLHRPEIACLDPTKPSELLLRLNHRSSPPDAALRAEPPPTLQQATYEHMSRILVDCNGNVSEAARRLRTHRQSLQRHLKRSATGS